MDPNKGLYFESSSWDEFEKAQKAMASMGPLNMITSFTKLEPQVAGFKRAVLLLLCNKIRPVKEEHEARAKARVESHRDESYDKLKILLRNTFQEFDRALDTEKDQLVALRAIWTSSTVGDAQKKVLTDKVIETLCITHALAYFHKEIEKILVRRDHEVD